MNPTRFLRACAFVAACALLGACQIAPVKREPPPLPFTGTKWMMVTERKPAGEAPYLEFGDGAVTGSSGCNRIMGRYMQDAVGAGAIVFSSIATTKRMCGDASMAVEERLLSVLRTSTNVKVTGDTLRIDGSAGSLDFSAATR
ncbi:MAG TPA: META domain-containing protein [Usitatibacteraceae bacterium]|nr:META domain-containing protein [Usitatibacteraceae bacterium]